jgi:hypothetical protein
MITPDASPSDAAIETAEATLPEATAGNRTMKRQMDQRNEVEGVEPPRRRPRRYPSRKTSVVNYREPNLFLKSMCDDTEGDGYDKEDDNEDIDIDIEDNEITTVTNNSGSESQRGWNKYISAMDAMWEFKFKLLIEYKRKHGNTRASRAVPILGTWVAEQRKLYRKGTIKEYRKQKLNAIGLEGYIQDNWYEMYEKLCVWKQHNGSAHCPKQCPGNKQLGNWLYYQRAHYQRGTMTKLRMDLLDSIGLQWQRRELNSWMDMYERLLAYKKKYKNVRVPYRYLDDPLLGFWVQNQQYSCNENEKYHVQLLNEIGFEWSPIKEYWMEMYHRLECYKQQYGNTRVLKEWKVDPKLAAWVQLQRRICEDDAHVDLLNELGFEWNPNHSDWVEMYNRLVAHKQKYGTTKVLQRWKEDPNLGRWVVKQRATCKEKNYIDLLNELGFIWNGRQKEVTSKRKIDDWLVMYRRLVAHKEKTGSTRVTQRHKEDPKLGRWVVKQRATCIGQHQVDLLNEIGFAWDGKKEAKEDKSIPEARAKAQHELWLEMYRRLVAHKEKTGSTRVTQRHKEDPKLGRWVVTQRLDCRELMYIDLLNKIDFSWDGKQEMTHENSKRSSRLATK